MRTTRNIIEKLHKLLAILVGMPLLAFGIVMIPVPGPGLLICFLSLLIMSTAFDWPKPYLEKIKIQIKKIINIAKQKEAEFNRKHDI